MKYTMLYIAKRIVCTLCCVCVLFCLAACSGENDRTSGTEGQSSVPSESAYTFDTIPTTEPPLPTENSEDPSLIIFRQAMVETPQFFAAAFFGYVPQDADPVVLMQENAPQLCEDLPFLLTIDQDHIFGVEGQLFCIVPADENATVAVNRGIWNEEDAVFECTDVIFRSERGAPILVMCNNSEWEPDTEIVVTDSNGNVAVWYPHMDSSYSFAPLYNDNGESMIFDFTSYDEFPHPGRNQEIDSSELVGTWELAWTEVEGDRNEAAPGVCTIEITPDETDSFRFTYTNKDFPEENVQNRELIVVPGELYPGCSNDQWIGEVTETSGDTVQYALTLLEDGTLLLQTYWEMDGMPWVSYGWYARID